MREKLEANSLNIYCDESHHIEHDGFDFMVLGAIVCHNQKYKQLKDKIQAIKKKHGFDLNYEIKWTSVSPKSLNMIKELLTLLKREPSISVRILIAKGKTALDLDWFGMNYDDWYYSMYFYMLKHPLKSQMNKVKNFNLFIDKKDGYSELRCINISKRLSKHIERGNIHSQACDSKEFLLIQLTDVIIGSVSYFMKKLDGNPSKKALVSFIQNEFSINFASKTPWNARKFNIFIWEPSVLKESAF